MMIVISYFCASPNKYGKSRFVDASSLGHLLRCHVVSATAVLSATGRNGRGLS